MKSRSAFGNLTAVTENKGLFSSFGKKEEKSEEAKEAESQGSKSSWFSNLGKKTTDHMRQLIGADERKASPMKWENFLKVGVMARNCYTLAEDIYCHKVMREMGFRCDPATAGSSVRFDPPDPRDRSITFHKRGTFSQNATIRELKSP